MQSEIRLNLEETNDPQQESQILNKKFIELIKSRQEISQNEKKSFTEEQIQLFAMRFKQLCPYQQMDYFQFRKGLGLLGRQDSFLSRIFYTLDEEQKGYLTFDDYLGYLDIILNGSDIQKARFSWTVLTGGKGQLEVQDLMLIFQEISVVWNALTGEIITPKKRYVQELFNIFDVDQDQLITFSDFQVIFDEHPSLFGWFQYLNNIDIEETKVEKELADVRKKLHEKLNLQGHFYEDLSYEEIRQRLDENEYIMQKKMRNLTTGMHQTAEYHRQKSKVGLGLSKKTTLEESQFTMKKTFDLENSLTKSQFSEISLDSVKPLRSFFKYNHQTENSDRQMNRIKARRQKQEQENKINSGIQLMKDLQSMLIQVESLMGNCHEYRTLKTKQKKFSPNKLKQLQFKYQIVDRELKSQGKQKTKKKMTVYFGHENWNVVLNIMVGLRKSLKSLYNLASHLKIKDEYFSQEHEFVLGNKTLMGKDSQVYKFVEKAPLIFQRLRMMYSVSNEQYQRSVGPQSLLNQLFVGNLQALNQKCSTGKSGAFFYQTLDNKIFLKTVTKNEYLFFERMLKNYYEHMRDYKNSLIVRVYGLYKLKLFINKQKIRTLYFISMENIFAQISAENNLQIKEIYDLKGSLYGRTGEQNSQMKDQDWINHKKTIDLPLNVRQTFIDQVILDSKFFKRNNINDYSMMVAYIGLEEDSVLIEKETQNIFKRFNGGVKSRQKGLLYVISIIDFLTSFETFKNMEYLFKSTFLSKDISCVPPAEYSKRFRDFILNSVSKAQ